MCPTTIRGYATHLSIHHGTTLKKVQLGRSWVGCVNMANSFKENLGIVTNFRGKASFTQSALYYQHNIYFRTISSSNAPAESTSSLLKAARNPNIRIRFVISIILGSWKRTSLHRSGKLRKYAKSRDFRQILFTSLIFLM